MRLISAKLLLSVIVPVLLASACLPELPREGSSSSATSVPDAAASQLPVLGKGSSGTQAQGCGAPEGIPWVPVESNRFNAAAPAQYEQKIFLQTGQILGAAQGLSSELELSFRIPLEEDLGAEGSLTLSAQSVDLPSDLVGAVTPVLVGLSDGKEEYISLPTSGAAADCSRAGFYLQGPNNRYTRNSNCRLQPGSAFADDSEWWRSQDLVNDRNLSVNSFPTCRSGLNPADCPFQNGQFSETGRLPFGPGRTFVARYVLLARSYPTIPDGYRGSLKLTVTKKRKISLGEGVVDVDFVIVGRKNLEDSRTASGARNLNALLTHVRAHFAQPSMGITLGEIRAYEWGCSEGGDQYAQISAEEVPQLFQAGSKFASVAEAGRAQTPRVRVFLVSAIESKADHLTFLGIAGAVGGAPISGTGASGLVFSTFDGLAQANPRCEGQQVCPLNLQEASFVDLAATMTHEMGHFLGLGHLSEAIANARDSLSDTPECHVGENRAGRMILTANSCSQDEGVFPLSGMSCRTACAGYDGKTQFCPEAAECEFNHAMWWTAKSFLPAEGKGDGVLFSRDSGRRVRLSPFVL